MGRLRAFLVPILAFVTFTASQTPLEKPRYSVVNLKGPGNIHGYANVRQETPQSMVTFEGMVENLPPDTYDINVHESGDVSDGCAHVGGHFNPTNQRHGKLTDPERHAGDLGFIESIIGIARTIAPITVATPSLTLYGTGKRNIINRSLVISKRTDPEEPVVCGVIVYEENPKVEEELKSLHEQLVEKGNDVDVDTTIRNFEEKIGAEILPTIGSNIIHNIGGHIAPLVRKLPIHRLLRHRLGHHEYPAVNVDNIGLLPDPSTLLQNPGQLVELAEQLLRDYKNNFTVCFPPLGCLHTDPSWYHPKHRIVNLRPQDPSVIRTTFLLRTRENCYKEQILDPMNLHTIERSSFSANRPTKFIVHGFTNSGRDMWVRRMTDALLLAGDFNVFAVDWMHGALPIYAQATANTRVVGLQIAYLIKTLMNHKRLNPADVHIIGHSLGAQVAGYAGQNVTNLGRITGLDPAGPYFINMPPEVRLDPNDAVYVEALHTNALLLFQLGYGTTQLVGNLDFFPNGGQYQAGCELLSLKYIPFMKQFWNAGDIFACNHNRAVDLYIDAVTSPMTGFLCEDYPTFLRAACQACRDGGDISVCSARFGLQTETERFSNKLNLPMYFMTNAYSPFKLIHYRVVLQTDPTQTVIGTLGLLNITVIGDANELRNHPLYEKNIRLEPGKAHSFLLTSSIDLGNIVEMRLHWKPTTCLGEIITPICGKPLFVNYVTFGRMKLQDPEARNSKKFEVCEDRTETHTGGGLGDAVPVRFGSYYSLHAGESAPFIKAPCPL